MFFLGFCLFVISFPQLLLETKIGKQKEKFQVLVFLYILTCTYIVIWFILNQENIFVYFYD